MDLMHDVEIKMQITEIFEIKVFILFQIPRLYNREKEYVFNNIKIEYVGRVAQSGWTIR